MNLDTERQSINREKKLGIFIVAEVTNYDATQINILTRSCLEGRLDARADKAGIGAPKPKISRKMTFSDR